ncbi:hypothetical protein DL767_005047 [Monosporascus sp. MG133]|nr:hypothetical protein DL767_005047 [Monosporascus sp. MG133]
MIEKPDLRAALHTGLGANAAVSADAGVEHAGLVPDVGVPKGDRLVDAGAGADGGFDVDRGWSGASRRAVDREVEKSFRQPRLLSSLYVWRYRWAACQAWLMRMFASAVMPATT